MIDAEKRPVKRLFEKTPKSPFLRLLDYACVINGVESWYQLLRICSTAYPTTQTWTIQGLLRWRDREALPDDYRLLCIADLAGVSMEYALVCRGASLAQTPAAVESWAAIERLVMEDGRAVPDWERYRAAVEVEA